MTTVNIVITTKNYFTFFTNSSSYLLGSIYFFSSISTLSSKHINAFAPIKYYNTNGSIFFLSSSSSFIIYITYSYCFFIVSYVVFLSIANNSKITLRGKRFGTFIYYKCFMCALASNVKYNLCNLDMFFIIIIISILL